jgi:hypothetical protein
MRRRRRRRRESEEKEVTGLAALYTLGYRRRTKYGGASGVNFYYF